MAGLVLTRPGELVALLPPRGSLLGLDASKRRLGVAGTDPERRLVTPLWTVERRPGVAVPPRLAATAAERGAVGLVLGLPLNMDGTAGPMAAAARALATILSRGLGLPVLLQDERLTTFAVEQAIEEGRLARPKRGQPLDHYAAAVILEDALRAVRAVS
jgi:putative Holliday junction resolvase